jgi:hypothetical protein
MPVLNSVHLWGRYKQEFDPNVEAYTLFHSAPLLRQHYEEKKIYRNVQWVYGMKSLKTALKFGGQAVYVITVPAKLANSMVDLCKETYALPPF